MAELIYSTETYEIVGSCMEVHRELGKGHSEILYKDALQLELSSRRITFDREVEYTVAYKGVVLPHKYFSDFVVLDKIIVEVKAVDRLIDSHVRQVLNYLAAAKLKLGILVNFGEDSLVWKRVVL